MPAPYIPTADAAIDAWSANFSTLITAAPATYGLLAADAVAITATVALYHSAYLLGGMSGTIPKTPVNPATRTSVTIANKDSAKGAMLPILREYAILIRNNSGVTNGNKTALGLTIVKTVPTPIPAPVTYPLLSLVAATPGVVTFGARDSATPTSRAKPFGATGLQLFVHYSATVPVGPDLGDYIDMETKTPFQVEFAGADAGKLGWIWGRWITRRGLVGGFSAPLAFTVPTGGA